MKVSHRPGLLLVLAAALVHGALLGSVRMRAGSIDAYAFRSLDSREYYAIAQNVVEHGAFSQDKPRVGEPLRPDTWRTPGYPLFLAAAMRIVGKSATALVFVQQVLAVLNVWLAYRIARGAVGERRAVAFAVLFLLEPYHLFYSLWLLATTWFTTVLLAAWAAWNELASALRQVDRPEWRLFATGALLGALCGFLVLVRPVAVLIPFVVFVGLIIDRVRFRNDDGHIAGNAFLSISAFVLFGLFMTGGWCVRNALHTGHAALSDQSGVVLAYFKAAEVELWRRGRAPDRYLETSLDPTRRDAPHTVWEDVDRKLRERLSDLPPELRERLRWPDLAQGNRTPADSFRVSAALTRVAGGYLLRNPLSTLSCCLVRCGSILTFPLNLAVSPPNGIEVQRLRSTAMGATYLALVIAALAGPVRGRAAFCVVYFPAACTLALLLATTPQVDPRFRVPMIPLLLFLALLPRAGTGRRDENGYSASSASRGASPS
jgi:hypothetical protein